MEQFISITPRGRVFDGKAPAYVRDKLTAAMYEAISFLETKVKENLPTRMDGHDRGVGVSGSEGGLRSTIHGEVEKGILAVKGIVAHGSLYGDIIEKGRGPGPISRAGMRALQRWVELKIGFSADGQFEKRVTFLVARKIRQRGFKGIHMFQRAFDDNYMLVWRIFDRHGFDMAGDL